MIDKKKEKIRKYLERYRQLERKKSLGENFFFFCSLILLFLFISLLLEHLFFLGVKGIFSIRTLSVSIFFLIVLRYYFTVRNWNKTSYETLALKLEKKLPEFNTHLINTWQLRNNKVFPQSFIDLLKEKTITLTQKLHSEKAINIKNLLRYKKLALISFFLFTLYLVLFPSESKNGFMKIFCPINKFTEFIRVEPGSCTIEEGAPLKIKVYLKNSDITPFIEIKKEEQKEMFKEKDYYSFSIPSVKEEFSYRIKWGNKNTDWYKIEVRRETILTKLFIRYDYPSYTKLKRRTEEREFGEISTLYGTRISIQPFFSNPVEALSLEVGLDKVLYSKKRRKTDQFTFYADNATLYRFKYYDPLIKEYRETKKERLNIIFDSAPFIEFIEPGKDVYSKGGESLSLKINAKDDFGIKSIKVRKQAKKGDISDKDPIIRHFSFNGQKDVTISLSIKIPEKFETPISYYAESTDNSPTKNTGFSLIYYIYPTTKQLSNSQTQREKTGIEEILKREVEEYKSEFEKFIVEEKKLIEAAKKLAQREDYSDMKGRREEMAEIQNKWKEFFQKMVDDLHKIATQTKGKFTLSDELVEMVAHIQSSEEMLKKEPIHLAIPAAQSGLELAEEITTNLEKWLAEIPDFIKWEMEEPKKEYDVPEAPLPNELEDIIGELLEEEEDMKEEIEDVTSSWMDSMDKGAGWGTLDGPISNMSAKGVTGNLMPNQQEIGGRSGEGRTGRSYGEMVEKTATGKGGRKTPARVTPDNLEPGEIEDSSGETPIGPTGGGKISGWGEEGLEGPQQSIDFKYDLLAEKQQKIIEKTESLVREMKVLNIYNPELEKALSGMKEFKANLKEGRYKQDMLTKKNLIIYQLRKADTFLLRQKIVSVENKSSAPKTKEELGGVWNDKIPFGYEKMVKEYYKEIYKK